MKYYIIKNKAHSATIELTLQICLQLSTAMLAARTSTTSIIAGSGTLNLAVVTDLRNIKLFPNGRLKCGGLLGTVTGDPTLWGGGGGGGAGGAAGPAGGGGAERG
jgi:hypothetical protein